MSCNLLQATRRVWCVAAAVMAAFTFTLPARAAEYPQRPVTLLVGYPAGGSVDQVARVLAEAMSRELGVATVVENIGGAAGTIGAQRAARAEPDGYTVFVGSNNELAATKTLNPGQPYDPRTAFAPIGLIARAPVLLAASPGAGLATLDEFLAEARSRGDRFSFGSSGVGSVLHFAGELLQQTGKFTMVHIPYRGVAPLTSDLVAGRLEVAMVSPTAALPLAQDGRLRILGSTGLERSPVMPDVPTLNEHPDLAGYSLEGWFALVAPAGIPEAARERLGMALAGALQDPAVRDSLQRAAMTMASGQEPLAELIAAELARYEALAESGGMRQ
ncbi:MAG: tripartite tricarboxylate transporter substrate binding protein [Pigmentiphaga sp.]|nr:tripartite tricarboxylate transporter substrate binding protein [Pigmentiphaga sp.]